MYPRLSNRYTCKSIYNVKPKPFYCTPKFGWKHNLILNISCVSPDCKTRVLATLLISYTDSKREVRLKIIERIAIFFWSFGPKFGLKMGGGGGGRKGSLPWIRHCNHCFFSLLLLSFSSFFLFLLSFFFITAILELIELKKPPFPNPTLFWMFFKAIFENCF